MKFFDRFRKKKDEDQRPQSAPPAPDEPAVPVAPTDEDERPATAAAAAADIDAAPAPVAAHTETAAQDAAELPPASEETAAVEPPPASPAAAAGTAPQPEPVEPEPEQKNGWFARLRAGLKRTSDSFAEGMGNLFLGKKEIDDELLEELETQLLVADVGIEATQHVIGNLTRRVSRKELADADALYSALQEELEALLEPATAPLEIDTSRRPFVILMVGVNGVGKTTTIGKLARRYMAEGRSVMLAAGDTFRAAAVEQLQVWGDRNKVPVVAQHTGADSASVIFDALQAAQARNTDVLIADTAGRLHNKEHLMEELKKVVRVMRKLDPTAPHEVMLVLDAGTGQNALSQARHFQEAVGVTGITLTKLDGTAKGGIIFGISRQCQLPIRFIGVGEQAEDLRPFVAHDFVKALFDREPG
ncbi:MAG: signal recognition particle-docking protein FtsY [Spongiibacteraceae bacterium]|jgi:fused signal recognition particle receptor|nr:signal recognition particle-docking protein FtsY [Spongiibacteraceae bacterium]